MLSCNRGITDNSVAVFPSLDIENSDSLSLKRLSIGDFKYTATRISWCFQPEAGWRGKPCRHADHGYGWGILCVCSLSRGFQCVLSCVLCDRAARGILKEAGTGRGMLAGMQGQ